MQDAKVIDLDQVRGLVAELDKVRRRITAGELIGYHVVVCDAAYEATVCSGGLYRENPDALMDVVIKEHMGRALGASKAPMLRSVKA